jgi:hypothetical protein
MMNAPKEVDMHQVKRSLHLIVALAALELAARAGFAQSVDYADALRSLPALEKPHYSWPTAPEVLAQHAEVAREYARITGSLSVSLRYDAEQMTAVAELAREAGASLCVMSSPWNDHCESEPDWGPPSAVSRAGDPRVWSTCHEEELYELDAQLNVLQPIAEIAPIEAFLFDYEAFRYVEGDEEVNDAIIEKLDLYRQRVEQAFPNARQIWCGLGAAYPGTRGWVPVPYYPPGWLGGRVFSIEWYATWDLPIYRQCTRRVTANARQSGVDEVFVCACLAAGYRPTRQMNYVFDSQYEYDSSFSYKLGREINHPWFAKYPDFYAPYDEVDGVFFYPSGFRSLPGYPERWLRHFVAYVEGATGTDVTEPPPAPTNLTAAAVSHSQIDLAWDGSAAAGTTYEIYRATTEVAEPFTLVGTVSDNATAYSDVGLDPETEYCYAVRAANAVGSSGSSPTVCATTDSLPQHTLAVNVLGNGSVSRTPDRALYDLGEIVELTALPGPGWRFEVWSDDLDGANNPDTVTIIDDLAVTAAFVEAPQPSSLFEDFESYADGEHPDTWLDTGADYSLAQGQALFEVSEIGGNSVFGTTSTASDIHSHYVGPGNALWTGYEYSGCVMITHPRGGVGVTLLSDYPNSDSYYRLWRGDRPGGASFHISRHPDGLDILSGTTDTSVAPSQNAWYRFRIAVTDTGSETRIRAKVWPKDSAEPADWQADCTDDHGSRLTTGTVGLWSTGQGAKYWDDLGVKPLD